ncbi:MAG: cytochrome c [Gallionella sp.]|jgi:cytochrome c556
MLKKISMAVLSLLIGFSGIAQAEMSREDYAIKFRRGGYTVLGWYYGPLYRMAKGEMPYDKALFLRNAEYLAVLSKLPKDGFIPGTEKGDTKAKPEIWSKSDKFKEANDRLETESARLAELAKGGNLDVLKEQFGKLQKTCKACHDDFKNKAD